MLGGSVGQVTTPTNLRLPTELRELVDEYAGRTQRTLSGAAVRLLMLGLEVERRREAEQQLPSP